jgi:hypothetical protein
VRRFETGERIELRETWSGQTWEVREGIIIEDSAAVIAAFTPAGSRAQTAVGEDGVRLRLPTASWSLHDVRMPAGVNHVGVHRPGCEHSVLAVLDDSWRLLYWYINLESDLARNERGFEYVDHFLDVVVAPDLASWKWKDEDELAEAVERGLVTEAEAGSVRAEGERAVEWLLARRPPYDRPWEDWRPPASWERDKE